MAILVHQHRSSNQTVQDKRSNTVECSQEEFEEIIDALIAKQRLLIALGQIPDPNLFKSLRFYAKTKRFPQ